MRKLLIWIILCLSSQFAIAQSDAISNWLNQAEQNAGQDLDSALFYIDKAYILSKKSNNQAALFKVFRTKGFVLEEEKQWNAAIDAYQIAKNIAEQSLDEKSKLAIYNDWAIVHKHTNQFKITQEFHLKSIELAEKVNNWEAVEAGYHGLGTMYSMLSNFPQSIYNYRKSIEAAQKYNNKEGILISLQNISNVYFKSRDYDAALQNLNQSYQLAIELHDSLRIANAIKLEGSIALEQKNSSLALQKYKEAQSIYLKLNKKGRLAEMELLISELWVRENNYTEATKCFEKCENLKAFFQPYTIAEYYNKYGIFLNKTGHNLFAIKILNKGLEYADTTRFKEIAYDNHSLLAGLYKKNKQFELAVSHLQQANFLQKRLNEENNIKTISQVELQYELEKKDAELRQQRNEIQQSNILHWAMGISAFLLFILLYFTWKQLQAKKKAIVYTQLLLKELNHRVKNNLQNIISIIRLQSRTLEDVNAKKIVDDCQNRLEAVATLHQQFYQNDDINIVNFQLFLENLLENICFKQDALGKKINYSIAINNNAINIETALPIALIINELVTNSIKHAFKKATHPFITIHLDEKTLMYKDNGSFSGGEVFENKNFGYQLINDLTKQLSADFHFYEDNGFCFILKFYK